MQVYWLVSAKLWLDFIRITKNFNYTWEKKSGPDGSLERQKNTHTHRNEKKTDGDMDHYLSWVITVKHGLEEPTANSLLLDRSLTISSDLLGFFLTRQSWRLRLSRNSGIPRQRLFLSCRDFIRWIYKILYL